MTNPNTLTRDELIEEVIYLQRELGLMEDKHVMAQVMGAWKLTPQEARVMAALYANRRPNDLQALLDLTTKASLPDQLARTIIANMRKKLPKDFIETVRTIGYRLTPLGRAKVREKVSEE